MTDNLSNTTLGQYRLIEPVRQGGMATVYKAYQPALDRFVAVKVLLQQHDPQLLARFRAEARAIALLQHPHILPIYDYGEQNGSFYLVLQYVEGGASLDDLVGAPLAPTRAIGFITRLLAALDYAHAPGVVHRDIKPANVLLPAPDWPMLAGRIPSAPTTLRTTARRSHRMPASRIRSRSLAFTPTTARSTAARTAKACRARSSSPMRPPQAQSRSVFEAR